MIPDRPQPVDVLVEVADLGRVSAEGVSQKRADRFEYGVRRIIDSIIHAFD